MKSFVFVLCLLAAAVGYAQTQPAIREFKSNDANNALATADAAEAKARAEYEKAVVVAKTKLIADLEVAKDKAIAAKDLDEALKLRSRISALKEQLKPAATAKAAVMPTETDIDLLKAIDPKKDARSGAWKFDDGALLSDDSGWSRLNLNVKPPEEYDLKVEYTPYEKDGILVLQIDHGGESIHWMMTRNVGYFAKVDGKVQGNRTEIKLTPVTILNRKHVCIIKVRKNILGVFLDGKQLLAYKTDYSEFSTFVDWRTGAGNLGIGSHEGHIRFHAVTLTPIEAKK